MISDLRLATAADAAAIAAIYHPVVASTPISFEIEPPDENEMRLRIQDTLTAYPWLVCEIGNRIAGYAYASHHRVRPAYRWSVDVSIYVHADFRRRGNGRRLYAALFRILTAQGYFNAFAGIALPNPDSVKLHASLGFESVGVYRNAGYKLGAWHDVGWWQLTLQSPVPKPQPLLSLIEIQSNSLWPQILADRRSD